MVVFPLEMLVWAQLATFTKTHVDVVSRLYNNPLHFVSDEQCYLRSALQLPLPSEKHLLASRWDPGDTPASFDRRWQASLTTWTHITWEGGGRARKSGGARQTSRSAVLWISCSSGEFPPINANSRPQITRSNLLVIWCVSVPGVSAVLGSLP